ncbi:glycosyltransferase [Massilimicrobiota timonensis]|uniref:Glycosyl transferase family 1 domain-containing protein n=1 Tax=Massilimicrobiota timonensis TaxID=1776392 RepID=A0A1Y4SUM5_9FIRM|nr:glycosyltransferase [Massilimicrobiota timonensis]OUQ33619.1 hypothetical protein B5E75_09450 [Massilimicrobiota timonensis]
MAKIVFVIGSLGKGGAERVISILANNLNQRGYHVSIILVYENRIDYPINEKINIVCLNNYISSNYIVRIPSRVRYLRKIIKKMNCNLVISFLTEINIYSIVSLLFTHIPLIISERNDPYHDPHQKLLRFLRKVSYKYADGIVYQTEDAKRFFKRLYIKNRIIPNPIIENLPTHNKLNKRNNKIVTFCRLTEQKNLKMLINAYDKLPKQLKLEYQLEIYGEGPQKTLLKKYVQEKKLQTRVIFKPFSNNIHEEIINASLFVSTSDYEGISNSMLEALAIGLPVICTDCPIGGAKLAITNNYNGILVNIRDEETLTKKIKLLLENEDIADNISSHYKETREKFSESTIVDNWELFLKEII